MPPSTTEVVKDPQPVGAVRSQVAQDVMADQAQIDLPPPGQETATEEGQGPSTSTAEGQSLDCVEIDFNGTPWEEDIWHDKEYLVATKNATITIGKALHVSDYL